MHRMIAIVALATILAACADGNEASPDDAVTTSPERTPTAAPLTPLPPAEENVVLEIFTTSGDQSGNRFFTGSVALRETPIEVPLDATPAWIVAAPVADRIVWVIADVDGNVAAYAESEGEVEAFPIGEVSLPPGAPPTVIVGGSAVSLFQPSGAAPLAGHTLVDGAPVIVAADGTVFVGAEPVAGVRALPDGRIVVSSNDEVAFLADPTDRLTHGVLGDKTESESVVILEPGGASIQAILEAPGESVFEAISPMWSDVNGDGEEEVVVTASDGAGGAALTVYSATGELIASAPPIGTGNRWLNQLAVAPVGPNSETEVIEVRTPHIGGIVRWYRIAGDGLEVQAGAERYSTHRIGSRNLDQGIVVDADGDGTPDVIVPTQDQQTLVALTRTPEGADVVASAPLGAALASNVAAASRADGSATVAAGTEDGRLLIWP